jgi:hypothetical protein
VTCSAAASALAAPGLDRAGFRGIAGVAAASARAAGAVLGSLSGGQWAAVLGIGTVLLVLYLLGCAIWPYGPCFGCIGHPGKNRGSNGRRWGRCKRCRGSGERIRWGYRLLRNARGR